MGGAPEDYSENSESSQFLGDFTIMDIHKRVSAAQSAGFRFHQTECRDDSKLLNWVLKADYLDYALPDGWQSYTKPSRGSS